MTLQYNNKNYNSSCQDVINAIYYGLNNGMLSYDTTHVICDGSGQPMGAKFSAYPFTPYGEEFLSSKWKRRVNMILDGVCEETGKWIVAFILGASTWAAVSHFVLRNVFPNFQW